MNRNIIKYIAIIAMTLDHIGAYTPNIDSGLMFILRMIGRITFPIMCFFICEGFKYTHDRKKYALRLFLLAMISQITWTLLRYQTIFTPNLFLSLNTIFTLLLGYCLLCLIDSKLPLFTKIIVSILICSLSLLADYSLVGILYVLFFYIFSNHKYWKFYLPILYVFAVMLNIIINNMNYGEAMYSIILNIGLFLTIPIFYLYNNKSGSRNAFHKYSFYVYYPLHQFVLFLIIVLFN